MKFNRNDPQGIPLESQPDFDPLRQGDDGLWDLLGKAKPVEISPFFARNVLREVRLAQDQAQNASFSLPALLRRWRLAWIGVAALCVVSVTGVATLHQGESISLAQRSAQNEQIANLDEFLAYEPTSSWLDDQAN